ncbi:hypothetical protein PYCC9005_005114 [Savitreella phatthalungensis]
MDRYESRQGGEEISMWTGAVADLRSLKELHGQGESHAKQVTKLKKLLVGYEDEAKLLDNVDALSKASRDYVEVLERESAALEKVRESLDVLIALRLATESGVGAVDDVNRRNKKRKLAAHDVGLNGSSPGLGGIAGGKFNRAERETSRDIGTDDGASDVVTVSTTPPPQRFKKGKSSHHHHASNGAAKTPSSGSSANVRETSVGPGSRRAKDTSDHDDPAIRVGSNVAFKPPKTKGSDGGDWIQCVVLRISGGDGPKARVEVQDPEPDEQGNPGQTYKTTMSQLLHVPSSNHGLTPHPRGTIVLARYPETTTFYKAEVTASRRDICLLKFEGEEEIGKETEVERRLVLECPG